MKLVSDWKDFWKWHSTWIIVVLGALPYAWQELPEDVKLMIPDSYLGPIGILLAVAGVFGRIRDQS